LPSDFSEIILGNALRIDREPVLTVPEGHDQSERVEPWRSNYQPPNFPAFQHNDSKDKNSAPLTQFTALPKIDVIHWVPLWC